MITTLALMAAFAGITGTFHYAMSTGIFWIKFIGSGNKPSDMPNSINRAYTALVWKALGCAVLTITAAFFAGVWL